MEPNERSPAPAQEAPPGEPEHRAADLPPLYTEDTFVQVRDETGPSAGADRALETVFTVPLYLLAIPAGFLPHWFRGSFGTDRLPLRFGALASSIVQIAVALGLFGYFFMEYYQETMTLNALAAVSHNSYTQTPAQVLGLTMFIGYLFMTLPGLLCIYFLVEGMVRVIAASSDHAIGTAPLWLIGFAVHRLFRLGDDIKAVVPVVDEVHRDGDHMGVRIDTCRVRPWKKTDAIVIAGESYKIITQKVEETGTRRYRYFLEPTNTWFEPENVIDYNPELVLDEAKRQHKD